MEQAGVVHRFQTRGDLEYEVERFPDRPGRSRAEVILERLSNDLFEDDVGGAILQVANGVHRGDVRMPDPRRQPEGTRAHGLLPWAAGGEDQQNDLTTRWIFRFVEGTLGGGARSPGDAEAAGDIPSDQA